MLRSFLPIVAAMAVLVAVSPDAQANCDECFAAKQSISLERGRLIADFPGTGATLVACMAACEGKPKSERGGCVLASCGMACLFIGMDNCFHFFNRMAAVQARAKDVEHFCRARNCQ